MAAEEEAAAVVGFVPNGVAAPAAATLPNEKPPAPAAAPKDDGAAEDLAALGDGDAVGAEEADGAALVGVGTLSEAACSCFMTLA